MTIMNKTETLAAVNVLQSSRCVSRINETRDNKSSVAHASDRCQQRLCGGRELLCVQSCFVRVQKIRGSVNNYYHYYKGVYI